MDLDKALDILSYDDDYIGLVNGLKTDALISFIKKRKDGLYYLMYKISELKSKDKQWKKDKRDIISAINFLFDELGKGETK